MFRFRVPLAVLITWWMVMIDPCVGHEAGMGQDDQIRETANIIAKVTGWAKGAFNEIARACKAAPYGWMLGFGLGTIGSVKVFVFAFGFESTGVRKDTLASFLVRRQSGHILKGSLLAKGQAAGAGGLGIKLSVLLFVIGSAVGITLHRYH